MLEWIDIETELTSAFTVLIMTAVAVFAVVWVLKTRAEQTPSQRAAVWALAFGFLSVAGSLGFVGHAFVMSENARAVLWQPLFLCLGLAVSMFAVGVIIDITRTRVRAVIVAASAALAVVFYAMTIVFSGEFLVFVVYEAVIMMFAVVAYTGILVRRRARYARWMLAGIVVSLLAATIQATGAVSFRIIWEFDHNGGFHVVQTVGILLLVVGLRPVRAGSS